MMRRAVRWAAASPSIAKGTPTSDGREPRTNVIKGCADATVAPRRRRAPNSSLVRTPLECSATIPFQLPFVAKTCALEAISRSGTQNQITPGATCAWDTTTALELTSLANRLAFADEDFPARVMISAIENPALRRAAARAPARLPAPTIVIRGFATMPRQHSRSEV
jgi:hypothetical protein